MNRLQTASGKQRFHRIYKQRFRPAETRVAVRAN